MNLFLRGRDGSVTLRANHHLAFRRGRHLDGDVIDRVFSSREPHGAKSLQRQLLENRERQEQPGSERVEIARNHHSTSAAFSSN